MKHKFLGRTYRVSFVKALDYPKDMGECTYSEKIIRIKKSLKGLDLLDTICHESIHGGFDMLDEEVVDEFAADLAKLLWKLGYRKVEL